MTEKVPPRPPQVTLAAWLVIAGSVGIVVFAYLRLSTLGTLDTRESVADFLSKSPWDEIDLGVDRALDLIRVVTLVAAACATASMVLAREVLGRSRSARIALSVLAVPVLLTGSATGGFVNAVVASAVFVLWLKPARDWYDGVAPAPPPGPAQAGPVWPPPLVAPPEEPPAPGEWPPARPAYLPPLPIQSRPPAVAWAVALTWAGSALVALATVVGILYLAVDPGSIFDEIHRQNPDLESQGVTDAAISAALYVVYGALLIWCIGVSTVAGLLWRRRRWARTALLVSAGIAGGLLLVGTFAQYLLLLPLAACVATFVLLRRPEVDRWL